MPVQVGQTFGAWEIREIKNGKAQCLCKACGRALRWLRTSDLLAGATRMCRKCASSTGEGSTKYGKTSFEYNSWISMIQRCTNPKCKDYPNYGGRGIKVYDVWLESFEAFYLMVGPRPDPSFTLERIDYNKGYEPGNVTWLSRADQTKNKRDNVKLTIEGETKTVSDWSRDSRCPDNVTEYTIYKRLKRGWEPERAVFTPSAAKAKK